MTTALRAAALLVASLASLQTASSPQPRDGPRLVLEPASFDFGNALPVKRLTKEFSLRNLGSGQLVIEKLSSSCTCTAFLLDERDRKLAPGRNAPLRVTLTTPQRPGRVVETVRITSNDPARAVTEITVEATVTDKK